MFQSISSFKFVKNSNCFIAIKTLNYIYRFCFASELFPKFWKDVETELDEHEDDLITVKSILSALGYKTKGSIAAIKNAKNISNLEKEYMAMFANNDMSDILKKYPELKTINKFTPGMKAMLLVIVSHLNEMLQPENFDIPESIKEKVLNSARSYCANLSIDDIFLDHSPTGSICRVKCLQDKCDSKIKLSQFFNKKTKVTTYSISNYSRHLEVMHKESTSTDSTIVSGNAAQQVNSEPCTNCVSLKKRIEDLDTLMASSSTGILALLVNFVGYCFYSYLVFI